MAASYFFPSLDGKINVDQYRDHNPLSNNFNENRVLSFSANFIIIH